MAAPMVQCAKLGQLLPGIDEATPDGVRALKMCRMLGGQALADRVKAGVSAQAWKMWTDHQVMVVNEFRLDPSAPQANAILQKYMEAFFFGEEQAIPNYVPPASQPEP